MSFLGDALDFEKFQLSDWWKKIKDQPESLLLGMDPISTGFWNALGVGGGNQEPLVNVLGGPMGSGKAGLGSGGIYDDARAKGIDPGAANKIHDLAEVLAVIFATQGMGSAFGGAGAGGAAGGSAVLGGTAGMSATPTVLGGSGAVLGGTAGMSATPAVLGGSGAVLGGTSGMAAGGGMTAAGLGSAAVGGIGGGNAPSAAGQGDLSDQMRRRNPLQNNGQERDNRLDLLRLLVMMQEQIDRRNATIAKIGNLPVTGGVR